eukprot:gene1827-biopygen18402
MHDVHLRNLELFSCKRSWKQFAQKAIRQHTGSSSGRPAHTGSSSGCPASIPDRHPAAPPAYRIIIRPRQHTG